MEFTNVGYKDVGAYHKNIYSLRIILMSSGDLLIRVWWDLHLSYITAQTQSILTTDTSHCIDLVNVDNIIRTWTV